MPWDDGAQVAKDLIKMKNNKNVEHIQFTYLNWVVLSQKVRTATFFDLYTAEQS